jgi:BirA family biotin operon repressor/biotin-[acetyl-CoA-carboxylase] ligase
MMRMDDLMEEEVIQKALKTRIFGRVIYNFEEIDSTNRFAKRLALQGKPEGTLVYAEKQTHGRGRWSRSWDSPKGKGLWFSLVLRPKFKPALGSMLTLLGATSVASVVEENFRLRPKVKWPNDLLVNGRKLAGVLTEASRYRSGISYAVLGIGINVNQDKADFASNIRERAISLRMAGKDVDRLSLLSKILIQMENDYRKAQIWGFDFILRRWISRSSILCREVLLRVNSHTVRGRVRGFHANGDLVLLDGDGKERRYSDGDIVEVIDAVGR